MINTFDMKESIDNQKDKVTSMGISSLDGPASKTVCSQSDVDEIPSEERILKAAEKEFLEKGFAGARTTSIAEAAGVTHAMLHYYFRTKERLFEQIIQNKIGEIVKVLLISFDDGEGTVIDKVSRAVGLHFDFVRANSALPHFILSEVATSPVMMMRFTQKAKVFANDMLACVNELIREGVEKGECRYVDARMLMMDIFSLNLMTFAGLEVVKALMVKDDELEEFLDRRRQNNIDIITCKLTK